MNAMETAQEEIRFALVQGEPLTELPGNLYIPPEALEVFLEAFEGPLDLLLWLIKRQNLDILDIPIAQVARQYLAYIDMMKTLNLDIAGEYLLMAAMLAEIKSRMLLPRPVDREEEEEDPRANLIRRLQEYERYKSAARVLQDLPQMDRDLFLATGELAEVGWPAPLPARVSLADLQEALANLLDRLQLYRHHHIQVEALSVRERMTDILSRLDNEQFISFHDLLRADEGRLGVVVSFMAVLELLREALLEVVHEQPFSPLYLKRVA